MTWAITTSSRVLDIDLTGAVRKGQEARSLELLRQGARPMLDDFEFALEVAIQVVDATPQGQRIFTAVLNAAVAMGCDLEMETAKGTTVLMDAVNAADPWIVAELLAAGADPTATSSTRHNKTTPLHFIASGAEKDESKRIAVLDLLVGAGASLAAAGETGRTAFHYACQSPFRGLLEKMVAHGANPRELDFDGRNALHHAVMGWGTSNTLRFLFDNGVDLNRKLKPEFAGDTPLHLAVAAEHNMSLVSAMLELGADESALNSAGETARDAAKRRGQNNVLAVFEAKDAIRTVEQILSSSKTAPEKPKQKS